MGHSHRSVASDGVLSQAVEGVFLISGIPGAGKTTVARRLAQTFPIAAHIEADGQVFASMPATSGMWTWSPLALKSFAPNLGTFLKSFGQDQAGEVYLLTSDQEGPQGTTGKVYKLVAAK